MEQSPRVAPGAHVTLHYRIAVVVDGDEREVISTFASRPATMTIGDGQLAEPLEAHLLGLAEGDRAEFELAAGEGFGPRYPDLVRELSRATFDASQIDGGQQPGDMVHLASPEGVRLSGVIQSAGDEQLTVDFNHPLAGLPVRMAVHLIGVL
ncbi:MAG: FKBP-type peptidyl-prolyl cis-trans isomerase [Burkholderiaceae bacterium]